MTAHESTGNMVIYENGCNICVFNKRECLYRVLATHFKNFTVVSSFLEEI